MDQSNITKLLLKFQQIPKQKRARTFMEISGYPHYENVCSNVLQFYINPYNEHGLNDLFLNSLLKVISEDYNIEIGDKQVKVLREVQTLGGNRLDLLILTDYHAIGIENKIFHFLNNDLKDYKNTIFSYCNSQRLPINIVLSLYKITNADDIEKMDSNSFVNITYEKLFGQIKKNLGKYFTGSNPIYLTYLTDFIRTIQNLKPSTMENIELNKFFKEHSVAIQELTDRFADYKNSFSQKIFQLQGILPKELFAPNADKQWIYNSCCLVHDYSIGQYKISSDTYVSYKGWEIQLFARNSSSKEYLFNTMCQSENILPKALDEYERKDRIIYQRFGSEVELEVVAESLKDLLARIETYKIKQLKNV